MPPPLTPHEQALLRWKRDQEERIRREQAIRQAARGQGPPPQPTATPQITAEQLRQFAGEGAGLVPGTPPPAPTGRPQPSVPPGQVVPPLPDMRRDQDPSVMRSLGQGALAALMLNKQQWDEARRVGGKALEGYGAVQDIHAALQQATGVPLTRIPIPGVEGEIVGPPTPGSIAGFPGRWAGGWAGEKILGPREVDPEREREQERVQRTRGLMGQALRREISFKDWATGMREIQADRPGLTRHSSQFLLDPTLFLPAGGQARAPLAAYSAAKSLPLMNLLKAVRAGQPGAVRALGQQIVPQAAGRAAQVLRPVEAVENIIGEAARGGIDLGRRGVGLGRRGVGLGRRGLERLGVMKPGAAPVTRVTPAFQRKPLFGDFWTGEKPAGLGTGRGTPTYMNGKVKRKYPRSSSEVDRELAQVRKAIAEQEKQLANQPRLSTQEGWAQPARLRKQKTILAAKRQKIDRLRAYEGALGNFRGQIRTFEQGLPLANWGFPIRGDAAAGPGARFAAGVKKSSQEWEKIYRDEEGIILRDHGGWNKGFDASGKSEFKKDWAKRITHDEFQAKLNRSRVEVVGGRGPQAGLADEAAFNDPSKPGYRPMRRIPGTQSSEEWAKLYEEEHGIKILDRDGWDRTGDFDADWAKRITQDEFERKMGQSTVQLVRINRVGPQAGAGGRGDGPPPRDPAPVGPGEGGGGNRLPPKINPDGGSTPSPLFEDAKARLIAIIRGAARVGEKEIGIERYAQRKRIAGEIASRAPAEEIDRRGRLVRAIQKGVLEVPELELAGGQGLGPEDVTVLKKAIWDWFGVERSMTAANVDFALENMALHGKIPTRGELLHLEDVFGGELIETILSKRTPGQKRWELAAEIWNLPRAFLASYDHSLVLRQGLHLLAEGTPGAKGLLASMKSLRKAGHEEVNKVIRSNEWYKSARESGLDLTGGSATGMLGKEEMFVGSRLAKKIPVFGKGVEVSERLAHGFMNKLRMEVYASHAAELTRIFTKKGSLNETAKQMVAREKGLDDALKELANTINVLSGRADLGKAENAAAILNGMFFSARLNWARAQQPFLVFRQLPRLKTEEGRHMAKMLAKNTYALWGGIVGMLTLASWSGVAEVELNPRSSDFGKMRIGRVRIDPWGGQQQLAVLIARLRYQEKKTITTRQEVPQDIGVTLWRFFESKSHPMIGQAAAQVRQETFVGEEMTPSVFLKSWLPMYAQDVWDISHEASPGVAVAAGTLGFFGVSAYSIPGVDPDLIDEVVHYIDEYNSIPVDRLDLARNADVEPRLRSRYQTVGALQYSRDQYRRQYPEAEAALFLTGQVTSFLTREAMLRVRDYVKEYNLDFERISGIDKRMERRKKAYQAGIRLDVNDVDILIHLLTSDVPIQNLRTWEPTFGSEMP